MKSEPLCERARKWMRLNHGKTVFAPFTGQDDPAFSAFVHGLALYGNSDELGRSNALSLMRHAVLAMQPTTRWMAREVIPFQFDWNDRDALWIKIVGSQIAGVLGSPVPREAIRRRAETGGAR